MSISRLSVLPPPHPGTGTEPRGEQVNIKLYQGQSSQRCASLVLSTRLMGQFTHNYTQNLIRHSSQYNHSKSFWNSIFSTDIEGIHPLRICPIGFLKNYVRDANRGDNYYISNWDIAHPSIWQATIIRSVDYKLIRINCIMLKL